MPNKPLLLGSSARDLARAAGLLARGSLVAFPTETVYGLGTDATNDPAVARIFAVKGRPQFNPLICHVPDVAQAQRLARFDSRALALADAFWPGPLTLVLPRSPSCPVSLLASAGLDTLALRVPGLALARDLIEAAGKPIAAPSANRSGRISPTEAAHVEAELGSLVDAIVNGGRAQVGLESTVIDLSGAFPLLLRPGGLARDLIEEVTGPLGTPQAQDPKRAPGLLMSHYAPALPLRLNARSVAPTEGLIAFGPSVVNGAALTFNLSEKGDLREAAAQLFRVLRALDRPELSGIAVMPIPETGLGEAINDRLRRAAAPR